MYASERDRPDVVRARELYQRRRLRWSRSRLWFVDESGVNLTLTPSSAWAPLGERVVDHVPGGTWETYTLIAALRVDGLYAPMLLPGSMNTEALRAWVAKCLAPLLADGDIVVWDNLGIHDDFEADLAIQAAGARLEFLPPYSPDLNPIEPAWSKAKALLRKLAARTYKALIHAADHALGAITPQDCLGWFLHCGYTRS